MSLYRIKLSSAVLAILTVVIILALTDIRARAGDVSCYPDFYAKINNWDDIRNCWNKRAVAVVALRLEGEKEADASTLVDKLFPDNVVKFDFVSGNPITSDPILFAQEVPACVRLGGYYGMKSCEVQYSPTTGQKMSSSDAAEFKDNWDCYFGGCADIIPEEDPKAIALIASNQRKLDRIVAKARRAALADCPSIWSTLVQAGIKTKSCDQLK